MAFEAARRLFLTMMDQFLFDLLRWTWDLTEERASRMGHGTPETDNTMRGHKEAQNELSHKKSHKAQEKRGPNADPLFLIILCLMCIFVANSLCLLWLKSSP